jgi:hypothetical protein
MKPNLQRETKHLNLSRGDVAMIFAQLDKLWQDGNAIPHAAEYLLRVYGLNNRSAAILLKAWSDTYGFALDRRVAVLFDDEAGPDV